MKPCLERLEDRLCPTVDITYQGGPLIAHEQVVDLHADASPAFTDSATQTALSLLSLLTPDYGVGAGTLAASVNVSPLAGNPSDAQIQQAIAAEIETGLVPPPSPSTVYQYLLAPGQVVADPWAGTNIGGYHSWFSLNGQQVFYTVQYDLPQYLPADILHELGETATDPNAGSGPLAFSGWVDLSLGGNGEVFDIYAFQPAAAFVANGMTFYAASGPQGQVLLPPVQAPTQPQQVVEQQIVSQIAVWRDLAALAVEQFNALAYRCLARIDPRDFAGAAQAAQQQLAEGPLANTPLGMAAREVGAMAFAQAIARP